MMIKKNLYNNGKTEEEKSKAFVDSILELNKKLGIEENIIELRKEDIPELAKRAVKEGNPTYPVPVIWEKDDFEKLIEKIV